MDGSQLVEPATTSFRWTVYLGRVTGARRPEDPLAQSLLRFTARQCNDAGVDRVELLAHAHENHPDGPSPTTTATIADVWCPGA
jgi:hypothetical protein